MTPSSPPDLAQRIASLPSPPERAFASDNAAGAHPAVIDAIVAANTGHALAYGADPWTAEFEDRCADLFGRPVGAYLVWNGTGANVMALANALGPADCVVCTEWSHIAVDEAGAPERILGVKLLPLPSADAKLVPEQLEALAHLQGVEHHAQPAVVSLTQCTELGTVYSADEIAALCATAHRMGMVVHLDGARLANACAALGGTRQALRSFTVDAGVDLISFGGTKNGLLGGEAVIVLNPALGRRAKFIRKMVNQLPSKMRFVAPVQRPARGRRVAGQRRPRQCHGHGAVRRRRRARWGARRRSPGGQQRVPVPSRLGHRPPARVVLLLGLGPRDPPSPLDDRLGYHLRRCFRVPGWRAPPRVLMSHSGNLLARCK